MPFEPFGPNKAVRSIFISLFRPNETVGSSLPACPNNIAWSFELVGTNETVGSFDQVGWIV